MPKIPGNMLQVSLVVLLIKKRDVETSLEGINLPKTLTQASQLIPQERKYAFVLSLVGPRVDS